MSNDICPICINNIENEFKTECGHIFCVDCIHCYSNICANLKCPMCREPIMINEMPYYGKILPFDLKNFPEDPQIQERIVLFGYRTIMKLNKWKLLYDYKVNNDTGFMFAKDKEINNLMNEIANDYQDHSGFSMGYTMRQLQFIAYYGINRYNKLKNI